MGIGGAVAGLSKVINPLMVSGVASNLFGMFGGGGDEEEEVTIMDLLSQLPGAAQIGMDTTSSIAPQQAQLQLDLLRQYGLPIAQEKYNAANTMYPYTTQLQEQLAKQASEGISAGLTANEARIVNDAIRGSLGTQAVSGLGVNRLASGLLNETRSRQLQYQNMGQALTNRMPLFTAETPAYTDYASMITPSTLLGLDQNMFNQLTAQQGAYSGGLSSMIGGIGSILGMLSNNGGNSTGSSLGGTSSSVGSIGNNGYVAPTSSYTSLGNNSWNIQPLKYS